MRWTDCVICVICIRTSYVLSGRDKHGGSKERKAVIASIVSDCTYKCLLCPDCAYDCTDRCTVDIGHRLSLQSRMTFSRRAAALLHFEVHHDSEFQNPPRGYYGDFTRAEFALQGPRKRGNAAIDGRPRANDQDARPGDAYGGPHSVPSSPISVSANY